ncbi:hypothetical protein FAZ95_25375 [Trinickia violacea]|uniref:DoxX family protein n=1 Tax=Trinickia violacea TaxID=2571746 RepID=A0A4P8IVM7_9BURK|nr:DoxX family protein [Trinickia violacea]QCP52501.1 hypothetical protein FAZ95_25375 [Trinickia violacea]
MEWNHSLVTTIAATLVSGLFAVAAAINLSGRGTVKQDFARWGYPAGFNLVCGGLELIGAVLLFVHTTRLWGLGLLAAIMAGVLATLARNKEPLRHFAPALVFSALLAVVGAAYV